MRVLLLQNPNAGKEKVSKEELTAMLTNAGHEVRYHSLKEKGTGRQLKEKVDLVMVAGGDGAVAKVARRLLGKALPMTVLPLGTANNLARSLGFHLPPAEAIPQLASGKGGGFDVGLARGPWGQRYFFEGVGAGLLAHYIDRPKEVVGAKSEEAELREHLKALRKRTRECEASTWEIELDGKDYSGRYLLWQAMNIRSVGPVLALAPKAKTDDGYFDFVGVREKDRPLLLRYLEQKAEGKRPRFPIAAQKFRRLRLRWKGERLHFDDQVWPEKKEKRAKRDEVVITVQHEALTVWNTRATEARKVKAVEEQPAEEKATTRES